MRKAPWVPGYFNYTYGISFCLIQVFKLNKLNQPFAFGLSLIALGAWLGVFLWFEEDLRYSKSVAKGFEKDQQAPLQSLEKMALIFSFADRDSRWSRFVWDRSGDGVQGEWALLYFLLGGFFTFLTLQVWVWFTGNKLNFCFRLFFKVLKNWLYDFRCSYLSLQFRRILIILSTANCPIGWCRFFRIGFCTCSFPIGKPPLWIKALYYKSMLIPRLYLFLVETPAFRLGNQTPFWNIFFIAGFLVKLARSLCTECPSFSNFPDMRATIQAINKLTLPVTFEIDLGLFRD